MRSFVNRMLLAALVATAVSAIPLHAQQPTCGTYRAMTGFDRAAAIRNTAERAPELYRQAVAEAKSTAPRLLSAEEESFWTPDFLLGQFQRVNAVRVHMGRLARIWVDVRDTGRADLKSKLAQLVTALEESTASSSRNPGKGIIENDVEVFGATPTTVGDGYQDFLLFDISDQSVLGFFFPSDQSTDQFSNRRNLLYIDSREGMSRTTSVLNTLAHEFQHLIHFGLNPAADLFINEGCSEVAGLMCGYPDRANPSYLRTTNTSMFDFPDDPVGQNLAYERALTVMHYLYEQYGDAFLRELPRTQRTGMVAINEALGAIQPGLRWDTVSIGFAVANWLQSSTDPRFGYRTRITSSTQRQARPLRTYMASTLRTLDTVVLAPYGIAYIVYDNPGQTLTMKVKGVGRYRYNTVAICYSGDNVEVRSFAPGETFTLGDGWPYDRVVLVLIETTNATQRMTWAINEAISGLEPEPAQAAATRLETIAPNPAHETAAISFTTGGGEVLLELYSATGERVLGVVDGERLEPGTHHRALDLSGLPAGAYVARLRDGDGVASQVVVVR